MSEEATTGEFRIILGQDGDFDLFDLTTSTPAIADADPESYDGDLRETVERLEPGNRIRATLVPTDEVRDNGLFESPVHRFANVEVEDRTRSYAGFGDVPIVGAADKLVTRLTMEQKGIGRANITSGDQYIGRVVVFNRDQSSPAEPVFEKELQSLREYGEPPFHVFQTATDDARFFVHYYLVTDDCALAEAFLKHIEAGDDEWRETKPPAEFRDDE
jgi:hypothetical protein